MNQKAIAIVSGGLDSVTLAYFLKAQRYDLHLLSFDYGQRHKKELEYAAHIAKRLNANHSIIDLTSFAPLLTGNALTDQNVAVPEGHYEAPNMAITVVPNRNAIMLSMAYAVAIAKKAQVVAIGVHGGDHVIYSDCRPAFIESFEKMEKLAVEGLGDPKLKLLAPFLSTDKAGIVNQGHKLGVPFIDTWSCYKGGPIHCGACGTCIERKEAFQKARVADPTTYTV